jgi:hypothetical protein
MRNLSRLSLMTLNRMCAHGTTGSQDTRAGTGSYLH